MRDRPRSQKETNRPENIRMQERGQKLQMMKVTCRKGARRR